MLVNVISSISPPSTLSRAKPRQFSKTQLETAARFCAAFDPSRRLPVIGISSSESAVEHGAERETARDVTIVDGDILGRSLLAESERALEADAIVPRGACVWKLFVHYLITPPVRNLNARLPYEDREQTASLDLNGPSVMMT